jgi:hypothetical protein
MKAGGAFSLRIITLTKVLKRRKAGRQAGIEGTYEPGEIIVTPAMRLAGACALEEIGSYEEKAAAAYRAMARADNFPKPRR